MAFFGLTETDFGSKGRAKVAFSRLGPDITIELKPKLEAWWRKVEQTARMLCPFQTGSLRDSIRVEKGGVGFGGASFEAAAEPSAYSDIINSSIWAGGPQYINYRTGKIVDYASFVHDGFIHRSGALVAPQPFLQTAIDLWIDELMLIIKTGVDKSTAKTGGD